LALSLACKYLTRTEVNGSGKRCSLLLYGSHYSHKKVLWFRPQELPAIVGNYYLNKLLKKKTPTMDLSAILAQGFTYSAITIVYV